MKAIGMNLRVICNPILAKEGNGKGEKREKKNVRKSRYNPDISHTHTHTHIYIYIHND
tara:strand:+ start:862 stop:1035 length:174 start_codon:yes stop_codon:yes gene_type:complete